MNIFKELGLVEILDSGAIYMMDIQNYIGKSSSEADRQRAYYNRIDREKTNSISCKKSYRKSTPEKEIRDARVNYQQIADMYNNTCVSFPRLNKLSESRKKAIKARLKTNKATRDLSGKSNCKGLYIPEEANIYPKEV